ncbi:transporter substrate-binding domain-containing protein [uncultured Tyzzerella sp.]|uniref:transporter substrate-binding domain-containing protein n=1 Tax=uncultured Tyzzerella sp. TaxID=2321398 RepID=UPI002941CB8D|nr:transporter substrate-binding domain-containing protein [uncultured Tyzzerella sp.]
MKKFLSLVAVATLSLSLVACGGTKSENNFPTEAISMESSEAQDSNVKDGVVAKIKEKGELVMATSPDYPPYEFKILEDGKEKVVGFDIKIAEEIAKDMGVSLRVLELDFNGLLMSLNANKADIVMAGMTPDEERIKAIDFSDIYYYAEQGIMVSAENKDSLNTLESFSGKKIGVQKGSIQEKIAIEQLPNAKILPLVKLPNIILELKSGNIDAAIVELPVANGYIKQYPEFALSDAKVIDETGGSAIAIKKGNQDLVDQVNSTIKRLQEEGTIDKYVIEANEIVDQLVE